MTTSETAFRKWFVDSLSPLRSNGDAGFIFVLTAFPLLERYLRRKTDCPNGGKLTTAFYSHLGVLCSGISGHERKFWNCYRNGLLHQATFQTAKLCLSGSWDPLPASGISSYDPRPVYFLEAEKKFILNPIAFFDKVVSTITSDFATYERSETPYHELPTVEILAAAIQPAESQVGLAYTGSCSP